MGHGVGLRAKGHHAHHARHPVDRAEGQPIDRGLHEEIAGEERGEPVLPAAQLPYFGQPDIQLQAAFDHRCGHHFQVWAGMHHKPGRVAIRLRHWGLVSSRRFARQSVYAAAGRGPRSAVARASGTQAQRCIQPVSRSGWLQRSDSDIGAASMLRASCTSAFSGDLYRRQGHSIQNVDNIFGGSVVNESDWSEVYTQERRQQNVRRNRRCGF